MGDGPSPISIISAPDSYKPFFKLFTNSGEDNRPSLQTMIFFCFLLKEEAKIFPNLSASILFRFFPTSPLISQALNILLSKFQSENNRKVCWKSELCDIDYTYSKEEYDRKYLNVETTFNPYNFTV